MLKVDERRTELSFKKGDLLTKQGMFMSLIIYVRKGFVIANRFPYKNPGTF